MNTDTLVHRWSEPRVTGHGFAWVCLDCERIAGPMPPPRDAVCDARALAHIRTLTAERDEARTAALHEAVAVLHGLAREYIARHGGGGDYCAGVFDAASRIEALTTTTNRSDDAR